jgi:two-component system KDP operon response regulator KdpE
MTSPQAARAILIVESDRKMTRLFAANLESEGYRVFEAAPGEPAVAALRTCAPDLVVLDLGTGEDGLALLSRIRTRTSAPIVVLSGRAPEADKIRVLDAGADDVLTRPLSLPELSARIRVRLRRLEEEPSPTGVVFGDHRFDFASRQLLRDGRPVHLSPIELKLLAALAEHADEVVTTRTLFRAAWGSRYRRPNAYVRVYIHALRRKIERDPARPTYLVNETGVGYALRTGGVAPPPSASP